MSSTALFTTIPMGKADPCAIKVQIQIIVPKQTYVFSPDTSCFGYSIKCQTMGNYLGTKVHSKLHVPALFQAAFYLPKRSHKRARALSLVPGYHSFPKWAIAYVRYIKILTWLRGFWVIFRYLVWVSLCSSLFWELRDNGVVKNL